jgi:hypothetical protein
MIEPMNVVEVDQAIARAGDLSIEAAAVIERLVATSWAKDRVIDRLRMGWKPEALACGGVWVRRDRGRDEECQAMSAPECIVAFPPKPS